MSFSCGGEVDLQLQACRYRCSLSQMCMKPQILRKSEKTAGLLPEDFCSAYVDSQQLPVGCDPIVSFKVLYEGFSMAFACWTFILDTIPELGLNGASTPGHSPEDYLDPMHLRGDNHCERNLTAGRLTHLKDVPQGSVRFAKRTGVRGSTNSLMSFSDTCQHALPIPAHSMHVGVNFVDLGVLAETLIAHQQLNEEETSNTHPIDSSSRPDILQWVGIESSSFCCAKTLVIMQMFRRGAAAGNVVQV